MEGVYALSKAFLSIDSMSHKKLQKLCFYAKAWYLALNDENLIDDEFEAWVHGAVNPDLYDIYKSYGYNDIPKVNPDLYNIPEEYIEFAREIYDSYGHLTGNQLEAINHSEDPWINARGECKPWERCNETIKEEDIKIYYRSKLG
jgi:uncharacterized phage-associated protein